MANQSDDIRNLREAIQNLTHAVTILQVTVDEATVDLQHAMRELRDMQEAWRQEHRSEQWGHVKPLSLKDTEMGP